MILPALAGTVRPGYKLAGPMYCPSERTAATYFCPNGPNMNMAGENVASVELTMLLVKPAKADRLIVHAVEAADIGQGVGLTPAVAAAAGDLTAAVLRDLAAVLTGERLTG